MAEMMTEMVLYLMQLAILLALLPAGETASIGETKTTKVRLRTWHAFEVIV